MWEHLSRDVRLAWRGLGRDTWPLAVAGICLALGIASATTLFGLVDALLIRNLSARDAQRLVSGPSLSLPNYRDVAASAIFESIAAGNQCGPLRWRESGRTRAIVGHCLSANFFETVGGHAAIGRVFGSEEATPERDPRLVLLSDRFWRRLGADPALVGTTIAINDLPFTVLGVLPPDYRSIQGYGVSPDVVLPYTPSVLPGLLDRNAPARDRLGIVGRLRPDRTLEQTREALQGTLETLHRQHPASMSDPRTNRVQLAPAAGFARFGDDEYDQFIVRGARVMTLLVAMVLAIACANAAGLLLARGMARAPMLTVQLALGASRRHLVRQLLFEAIAVAAVSTAAAFALSVWAGGVIASVDVPVQDTIVQLVTIRDWRLFAAASALGALCAIGSGLLPALASSRPDLRVLTSRAALPRLAARSWLVVGQLAVSMAVLCAALALIRNARTVVERSPGFDTSHVSWFDLAIDRRLGMPERIALRDRLVRAAEANPGVEAVSWAWYLPFQVAYPEPTVRPVDADGDAVRAIEQGIGPGYLAAMRIALVDGREFTDADLAAGRTGPEPVVINDTLARQLFPNTRAVGRLIARTGSSGPGKPMAVVGVARSTPFRLAGERPPALLHSLAPFTASLVVRTRTPAVSSLADVSRTLDDVAPGVLGGSFAIAERVANATFFARASATVLAVLAGLAVAMALTGLCGLVVYSVVRRTREAAIRMALGATGADVSRLMIKDHLRLVAAGCATGGLATLAIGVPIARFLVDGVDARDPAAVAGVSVCVMAAAALAIRLASRRVSRIVPASVLRAD